MSVRPMSIRTLTSLILFSLISFTSYAELSIKQGYVRAMPPGQPNTAAFMTLINTSDKEVTLVSASTDQSEKAEFHNHTMDSKGVMRMRAVATITIPAGGQFEFAPGSHHVMVMGLKKPLKPSQSVSLQLKDIDGKVYDYSLPVKSILTGHENQHDHHHGHGHHH